MKQLLEYIVPNIVNHPEAVEIQETQEGEVTIYLIKVDPEDMGRVIGKAGKVIKAIRQLAKIVAIKKGIRVRVDVWEENKVAPATPASDEDINLSGDIDLPQTEAAPAEEIPAEESSDTELVSDEEPSKE